MTLTKKRVYDQQTWVKEIIRITKEGHRIDVPQTRGSYGSSYVIAYEGLVVAEEATIEAEQSSEPVKFEQDLSALSLQELRQICDDKQIKYAPAAKEAKLIGLIKAAE